MLGESVISSEGELKVSFGYQCNGHNGRSCEISNNCENASRIKIQKTSSFSCLSGAALSANATLANTNICNGVIGAEILPTLDSPNSFHRIPSSPSLTRLDMISSSLQSSMSNLSCSPCSPSDLPDCDSYLLKSFSAPSRNEGFLCTTELQMAGGAAGEDRVQAVCSEEHGLLFCAIYDGFNGRDAADFLAGTLYENIMCYSNLLDGESNNDVTGGSDCSDLDTSLQYILDGNNVIREGTFHSRNGNNLSVKDWCPQLEISSGSFRHAVIDSLQRALDQAENDFLYMVEQEMEDRPDLVSVGSCVLVVLLHGNNLYTLNLGDSRAVLATFGDSDLKTVQLTESHTVENADERTRLIAEHPDDPKIIVAGKVKGKLKVTRALGVGYLKKVYTFILDSIFYFRSCMLIVSTIIPVRVIIHQCWYNI